MIHLQHGVGFSQMSAIGTKFPFSSALNSGSFRG